MEGDLQGLRLVSTLRSVGRKRKTGILTVQGPDEIIALSFSGGGIVGADALNQSLEEGLGEVLSRQQLVDSAEFSALAAEHEAGGGRVVDLLVERSFLSRGQLLAALRKHTYQLCLEALSWRSGEYRFYQGDEVAFEQGVEPIGASELLVRSSEDLGAAGPLPEPVPRLQDICSRQGGDLDEIDTEELGSAVLESARRALELIDGHRTLGEVAASCELTPYETRDLASEWQEKGLIEMTGSREAEVSIPLAPAPPAPAPPVSPSEFDFAPAVFEPEDPVSSVDIVAPLESAPQVVDATSSRPLPAPPRRATSRMPAISWEGMTIWMSRLCGVLVALATVVLMVVGPARVLLPFPWQGALREELRGDQRSLQRFKIEQGARTFFLLVGRYPENLDELEANGLVKRDDLTTPEGHRWRITPNPASFVLSASSGAENEEGTSWTSSIAGNFLLDPEFVGPAPSTTEPLLVLLD
jgi:hypothetical protein